MTSIQEIVKLFKPISDPTLAEQTLRQHWSTWCQSLDGEVETEIVVKVLDSYDDANYYIQVKYVNRTISPRKGLLKFYNATYTNPEVLATLASTSNSSSSSGSSSGNSSYSSDILDGLSLMLNQLTHKLASHNLSVPSIILPSNSNDKDLILLSQCPLANQSTAIVAVRLFTWIEGDTLSNYLSSLSLATTGSLHTIHVFDLFQQVGNSLGLMYRSSDGLSHPSFQREHIWDVQQFELVQSLRQYLPIEESSDVSIQSLPEIVEKVFKQYQHLKSRLSDKLPHSIIMGDANDANIIVHHQKVVGLIDFSDAIYTWTVSDVAIALAYALISAAATDYSVEIVSFLLIGYIKHRTLTVEELEILPVLMAVRLSASVMVGAYSIFKEPENEYLTLHAVPGRKSLRFWTTFPWEQHTKYFTDLQQTIADGSQFSSMSTESVLEIVTRLKARYYSSQK